MDGITTEKPSLTMTGCKMRQQRVAAALQAGNLDAALLSFRGHVHYVSGFWCRTILPVAMVIRADGHATLVCPFQSEEPVCADEVAVYESDRFCTLVEDLDGAVMTSALPPLAGCRRVACDEPTRPWALAPFQVEPLLDTMLSLRRTKDADEIALIRHALEGCDAAYVAARAVLAPGVTEVAVFAAMQEAAVNAVGESIGEFGNDFQSGTAGGAPRLRGVEAGELMPLDIGVVYRGYHSDICRTFSVDRSPTAAQQTAQSLVCEALQYFEENAGPGSSCRAIYDHVYGMLDGRHGWRFFHHLGHGVGLAPHEAPRLNPNWDDTLAVGDVVTVEPGLYGEPLREGIRLEHDYLVVEDGVERLSCYPLDL